MTRLQVSRGSHFFSYQATKTPIKAEFDPYASTVLKKMGHHGSPTCAVTFDRSPAFLIGKRGEGFKYMLTLMNNARVGVGFECIGLSESAYRVAQGYAEERPSMGKTIDKHEMIADYLDEMDTEIRGMRALGYGGSRRGRGTRSKDTAAFR